MMRVVWDEWRGGGRFSTGRILPLLALGAAAALMITRFQPGALFLVLVVAGLAAGVVSGAQKWNEVGAKDWVGTEGMSPLHYAAGKAIGVLLLLLAWAVFLLPLFTVLLLTWGVPLSLAFNAVVWALAAALAAQAVSHVINWTASDFQRFLAGVTVFLWMAVSLQITELKPLNALWQVWHQFHDPQSTLDLVSLSIVLGGTFLLWVVIVVILKRFESRR